jgi:hypothetical protein
MPSDLIHHCPRGDAQLTPCCGRSPFELLGDRMTLDPALANCPGVTPTKGSTMTHTELRTVRYDGAGPSIFVSYDPTSAFRPGTVKVMDQEGGTYHLTNRGEDIHPDVADLVEALRLTAEYVGQQTLPANAGWSWFDALTRHAPAIAREFTKDNAATVINGEHIVTGVFTSDGPLTVTGTMEALVRNEDDDEDGNLVRHARRELALLGEDPDTIEGYIQVIRAFSKMGHSGGSASIAIPTINRLLQFGNLRPITDNPDEWNHVTDAEHEPPAGLWQSARNPEAFSHDGGKTYYLLSERNAPAEPAVAPTDAQPYVAPLHEAEHFPTPDELDAALATLRAGGVNNAAQFDKLRDQAADRAFAAEQEATEQA